MWTFLYFHCHEGQLSQPEPLCTRVSIAFNVSGCRGRRRGQEQQQQHQHSRMYFIRRFDLAISGGRQHRAQAEQSRAEQQFVQQPTNHNQQEVSAKISVVSCGILRGSKQIGIRTLLVREDEELERLETPWVYRWCFVEPGDSSGSGQLLHNIFAKNNSVCQTQAVRQEKEKKTFSSVLSRTR